MAALLTILGTLLLVTFCCYECGQISSSMLNGYGLVGLIPSSADTAAKISYVAVVSQLGDAYSITNVFHLDDVSGFGVSVALGEATHFAKNVTFAAVGSKESDGSINIFDVSSGCPETGCVPDVSYVTGEASNCQAGSLVVAGYRFVASSCSANLLRTFPAQPVFSLCILQDLADGNCSMYTSVFARGMSQCSSQKGGQLVVSALDARGDMLAIAFCAICAAPHGQTYSMVHVSGFSVYRIRPDSNAYELLETFTVEDRSTSCPSSIAVNSRWLILGYADEGLLDFYISAGTANKYLRRQTIYHSDPPNFGASVDADDSVVVAGAKGIPATESQGGAFMFHLSESAMTSTPLQASIPCIKYPVEFGYTFSVSISNGAVFVVTQDRGLASWGYDMFESCDNGSQWNAGTHRCELCPPGHFKTTAPLPSTLELCTPCPAGNYSTTPGYCENVRCPNKKFCPAGSHDPIEPQHNYLIDSNPSPQATDSLDFENTFYYSCYPYFILFLSGIIAVAIPLCCTWPNRNRAQKRLVGVLLNLNFFYWPTGEEEGFFFDEEPEEKPLLVPLQRVKGERSVNGEYTTPGGDYNSKAKRRRHISQFLGSLCSYFFMCTLLLMVIFGFVFMSDNYNSSVDVDLQTIDESTTKDGMQDIYEMLQKVDQSPFQISLVVVGYNGECLPQEVSLNTVGCKSPSLQSSCFYQLNVTSTLDQLSHTNSCSILATFQSSALEQHASFSFSFAKSDFYAQQILYNISTYGRNASMQGTASIFGAIQPSDGDILRGNATVELLTLLTYISDCESTAASANLFVDGMVRVNQEKCTPNTYSFKGLSFLSSSKDIVKSSLFNNWNVSGFTCNVVFTKSPFYKNVAQSYFVSIGTILTITMLAALDVFWLVEALVPWVGFLIYQIQNLAIAIQLHFS